MDESLDDYISKANFKVKIGNPNYKGNKPNLGNKRKSGFQPIRPITAPQGSEIRDVSVTVPGVQKTGGNINRTNQIRDARERIIAKGKPQDARQKIQERGQGVDARQKITMKRIQVGPQDARAKLQAMKQQNEQTVTGPDGFSLTRTVSNNGKFQMAPQGAPADFQITKTIQRRHVPVIQVENDQYRPPQQQYTQYAPPPQPYSAPPPKSYPYAPQSDPVPQQQPYYTQADTSLQRTIPNEELPPPPSSFVKTIVNETAQYSPSSSSVPQLKRKSPGGPLRLSSTNTVPVIAGLDSEEETPKRNTTRYTKPVPQKVDDEPVVKKSKPEVVPESDVISPLQGFKVSIANLHVTVTQDDIIELFGSIGAVKKVRLLKPGTAEVFYVKKEDALNATKTYHERELDGQPMVVKLVTPATAKIKDPPEKLPPSFKPTTTGPLKLSKKPAGMAKVSEKKGVDVSVLHKALFKTGANSSAKPVTFTVNI